MLSLRSVYYEVEECIVAYFWDVGIFFVHKCLISRWKHKIGNVLITQIRHVFH